MFSLLEILHIYRRRLPSGVFEALRNFLWWRYWFRVEFETSQAAQEKVRGLRYSERGVLFEKIVSYYPFSSALEVGCGFGLNFRTLRDILHRPRFVGVDKNFGTIEEGRVMLGQRAELQVADLVNGLPFDDKEFDVVYTVASLLYVRADKMAAAARELLRVTRRALIIVEQHVEDPSFPEQDLGTFVTQSGDVSGYWLRDYKKLFSRFVDPSRIRLERIPQPRFESEKWKSYGYVIVVEP